MQSWLLLAVIAGVIALFASEALRPDLVAVLGLAVLLLLGLVPVDQAFAGLSSPATVTVACMFVLSAGLVSTGAVRLAGDRLLRHGPRSEAGLLVLIAFTIAPLSAFINNTAAVAIFLPIVLQASRGLRLSPSKLLMPMAFLAILGGTCTLIGTSTNILVTSMAAERGVPPFRMFEFTPAGLLWFAVGATYLLLVGRRLLVPRVAPGAADSGYHLGPFLGELRVLPGSPLAGLTLAEARLRARHGLQVLAIQRPGRELRPALGAGERLGEDDLLVVEATREDLMRVPESSGLRVRTGKHLDVEELRSADSLLIEAVVAPNSWLVGRTLKEADFRQRYGVTALAIRRRDTELAEKIGRVVLREGDELLVLAGETALDRLRRQRDFIVLQEIDSAPTIQPRRVLCAAAIFAGVVTLAAIGSFPVHVSAILGSVLMVLTGCLPLERVYESIDWRVIVLLGAIIPFGVALETTGLADGIVRRLVETVGEAGPHAVLATFIFVTSLVTGFVSNNATAALMVPLAIGAAESLGVSPRPFLVAVAFAASAAFYTPVGYQTNLLVYAPGGYRFTDYMRVGLPLNALFVLLGVVAIPRLFPF